MSNLQKTAEGIIHDAIGDAPESGWIGRAGSRGGQRIWNIRRNTLMGAERRGTTRNEGRYLED